MTIVIKKYDNRKLYDLSQSRYVTLEEIADLVRAGKKVQVVDAKTNEDLTNLTLAQIIVEDARSKKHALPSEFLHQLIQYGQSIQEAFQQSVTAGVNAWLESQREAGRQFQELGRVGRPWGGEPPREKASGGPRRGGPTDDLKDEVQELKQRLRELEEQLKKRRS